MEKHLYRGGYHVTPMWVRTALIILFLFFLFVGAVALFRGKELFVPLEDVQTSDAIVEELTRTYTDTKDSITRETPRSIPEATTLEGVVSLGAHATAKRVFENGRYTHTILAQWIPDINESTFHYQGWLIRPYPFDFIATSQLIRNADGTWGMIWIDETGESYDAFIDVLVTREPNNDFDENPSSVQILRGSF